jgi:pimeloyl-ACP methyl ester carboxylesterase
MSAVAASSSEVRSFSLPLGPLRFDGFAAGPPDGELVLFLHGWPEFADSWREILPSVAASGYHCVALDQRGYSPGARPTAVTDYALARLVEDALAVADHFGSGRFHLVGHDWGGLVAWALAADHGARLSSLTVLATPHPRALFTEADADQWARLNYVNLLRAPDGRAERVLLEDDARRVRAMYGGRVAADLVERNVARLAAPGALTATVNWYRACADDFDLGVDGVEVPTLFVWGTDDVALGRRAAEATAAWVHGSYLFAPLTGASHWLPDERPDEVLALLLAHLDRYPVG